MIHTHNLTYSHYARSLERHHVVLSNTYLPLRFSILFLFPHPRSPSNQTHTHTHATTTIFNTIHPAEIMCRIHVVFYPTCGHDVARHFTDHCRRHYLFRCNDNGPKEECSSGKKSRVTLHPLDGICGKCESERQVSQVSRVESN